MSGPGQLLAPVCRRRRLRLRRRRRRQRRRHGRIYRSKCVSLFPLQLAVRHGPPRFRPPVASDFALGFFLHFARPVLLSALFIVLRPPIDLKGLRRAHWSIVSPAIKAEASI